VFPFSALLREIEDLLEDNEEVSQGAPVLPVGISVQPTTGAEGAGSVATPVPEPDKS
jgi:hypothetical protein